MKIIINAFSSVKSVFGFQEKKMEYAEGSSVNDVIGQLFLEYPGLAKMKGKLLFAVNEQYCQVSQILHDGDSLAIFPPVSGG